MAAAVNVVTVVVSGRVTMAMMMVMMIVCVVAFGVSLPSVVVAIAVMYQIHHWCDQGGL